VELLQFYDMGRFPELSDIWANTAGVFLGALAAVAARRRLESPYLALLLVCWLGNRWYPAPPPLPAIRMGPLSLVSTIPALDLFRYFVAWLALGLMLESISDGPRSRAALPALLAVSLLLRALAVDVEPAEIAGGALAALAWGGVLWRVPARAAISAALFVGLVALVALAPFHFSATGRAFGWAPFRSFLEAAPGGAIRSFFEKAFLYGGMVWLLARAGLSAGWAAAFGAALVFCLRLTQVYLPGRSAEITDTILVLLFAALMKAISKTVSLARSPARDAL